jgi:predicted MFS family arabinose efflux permease
MRPVLSPALLASIAGLHACDQLTLAALPLIATLLHGAGPGAIGALVAAQGAAWLLVTLPAGVLVDRAPRAQVLRGAAIGAGLLSLAAMAAPGAWWLAILAFAAASAMVPGVLAGFAILPALVPRPALAAGNARLELARAVATLAGPPLAGLAAAWGEPRAALGLAALAGITAAIAAGRLPALPAPPSARPKLLAAIREGARFVRRESHLFAIAQVAVAWNLAFFALQAVLVPLALGPLGLGPATAGAAIGAYGAGLVVAALAAPALARRATPGAALLAGPLLSAIAAMLLLAAPHGPGALLLAAAQFLLGFGPMLWQVAQTSLRQVVTPPELLGRVGATLQVAVFGVRPLGALAGGALAAGFGPEAALLLAAGGFAVSLALVLRSPLPALRQLPAPV